MAKETGTEDQLPEGLPLGRPGAARRRPKRLEFYKLALIHLGSHGSMLVQEIFANASSFIKKPATLSTLVTEIDKLDWYSARQEGLGDLYEGLAGEERQREEVRRRPVLHAAAADRRMVAVMKPTLRRRDPGPGGGHGRLPDRRQPLHPRARQPRSLDRGAAAQVPARAPSTAWSTCRTRTAWR